MWFLFPSICRVEIMFFNTKLHFFWRIIWHSLLRTNLKNRRDWNWDSKSAASKDLIDYQQRYKSLWQLQKKTSLFNRCQNKVVTPVKRHSPGNRQVQSWVRHTLLPLHGYKPPLDCQWERNEPEDRHVPPRDKCLTLSKCLLVSSSRVWKWMLATRTSLKME